MIELIPMSAECFERFVEEAVEAYAADTVRAGRWTAADAERNSRAELHRFLPQGRATPGHHVCAIERAAHKKEVGTIWFGPMVREQGPVLYVYDLRIHAPYRRQGYAAAALRVVEQRARLNGHSSVMLHVFKHNLPALELYRKLGFTAIGGLMAKEVRA